MPELFLRRPQLQSFAAATVPIVLHSHQYSMPVVICVLSVYICSATIYSTINICILKFAWKLVFCIFTMIQKLVIAWLFFCQPAAEYWVTLITFFLHL